MTVRLEATRSESGDEDDASKGLLSPDEQTSIEPVEPAHAVVTESIFGNTTVR